jgi:hypothetical protein
MLYAKKCNEAFGISNGRACNICFHREKWEGASAKACWHASKRRTKYVYKLTPEELKLAKIYALAYAKEWIEFWKGENQNENRKTDGSRENSCLYERAVENVQFDGA